MMQNAAAAPRPIQSLTKPVRKESVVALVIDRIKEALLNKELRPGDFLPSETELAKNLGVGKSSVREALKMLQALGLVEVMRGQGTIIRKTPGEAIINPLIFQMIMEERTNQHIIDIRMMLEPAFTVMAMNRATEDDIAEIGGTVARFENSIRNGVQRAEDDLAFHMAILKATHNPFVIRIGETVLQLFKSSITKSMKTIPEVALKDHEQIFTAFREKDEAALQKAVLASFEGWKQSLERE